MNKMSPGFQRFTSLTSSHKRITHTLYHRIAIYLQTKITAILSFPSFITFQLCLRLLQIQIPTLC